ncbi:hypothetical protein AgCh_036948 [Apium graveolens]
MWIEKAGPLVTFGDNSKGLSEGYDCLQAGNVIIENLYIVLGTCYTLHLELDSSKMCTSVLLVGELKEEVSAPQFMDFVAADLLDYAISSSQSHFRYYLMSHKKMSSQTLEGNLDLYAKFFESLFTFPEFKSGTLKGKLATLILYGNDRATGEEAETASEMRKRAHSSAEFEFVDSIDDLDDRIQRNDVILENFDDFSFDGTDNFSTQSMPPQDPSPTASSGSKRKKSKAVASKEKSDEILEIKGAMQEVAEALKDGTAAIR